MTRGTIEYRCRVCQRTQTVDRLGHEPDGAVVEERVCGLHWHQTDPSRYTNDVTDTATRWFDANGEEVHRG